MPHRSYMVSPQGGGTIIPPASTRRWQPGWGPVLNNTQIYNGSGGSYSGIPNPGIVNSQGPCAPGAAMIVAPHAWSELEPNGEGDPAGTGSGQRFSGLQSIIQSELNQIAQFANPTPGNGPKNPVLYIPRVIFKTQNNFGGIIPLPKDMYKNSDQTGGTGSTTYATAITGGWSTWRWNAYVQQRYDDLCQAFATLFADNTGNNIYFGGIMTQETATSFQPTGTTDGYTDALFSQGLIAEAKSIATALPLCRPYFMINDWPANVNGNGTSVADGTLMLAQVVAAIHQYGPVIMFPDLATTTSVVSRYYAILQAAHSGGTFTNSSGSVTMPGKYATGGSIQPDEWGGNPNTTPKHGAGPGDYPVSIPNLFNYATASYAFKPAPGGNVNNDPNIGALDWRGTVSGQVSLLKLDCLFPDWNNDNLASPNAGGYIGGPIVFNPIAATMIASNPQFGNVTPNP